MASCSSSARHHLVSVDSFTVPTIRSGTRAAANSALRFHGTSDCRNGRLSSSGMYFRGTARRAICSAIATASLGMTPQSSGELTKSKFDDSDDGDERATDPRPCRSFGRGDLPTVSPILGVVAFLRPAGVEPSGVPQDGALSAETDEAPQNTASKAPDDRGRSAGASASSRIGNMPAAPASVRSCEHTER